MFRHIIIRYGALVIAGCIIAIALLLAKGKTISNTTAAIISLTVVSIALIVWILLFFRNLNNTSKEVSKTDKSSPFNAAVKIVGAAFVLALIRWAFYHRDVSYLMVVGIVFVILLVGVFIRNYRG